MFLRQKNKKHTESSENRSSVAHEFEQHTQSQLALCDTLEAIADSLPNNVSSQICLHAAQQIYPVVKLAHNFEEARLFPMLKANCELDMETVMNRLHSDHWADEEYSHELSESLKDYAAGRDNNHEKLGYMLRGFFEGLRRHIAYERTLLSPLFVSTSDKKF